MAWFAVYKDSDGALLQLGTILPSPMPVGYSSKQYAQKPGSNLYWDTTTKDYIIPAGT